MAQPLLDDRWYVWMHYIESMVGFLLLLMLIVACTYSIESTATATAIHAEGGGVVFGLMFLLG